MSKTAQSPNNTQPARLPALTVPPGVDPAVRQFMESVKERLEVRDGARGNPYERAVLVRDLPDMGIDAVVVGQKLAPAQAGRRQSSGGAALQSPTFPASIEALIRSSLSAEAAKLGADIRRVEHKLQSSVESSASVVEQLTASLGTATAGVRQVSYASATANRATAGLVTQLVAALDGTGAATLDESMVVIADRIEGLRSQYMLKLTAGNVVTGISLLASEDPGGITESAFIVQANRFQVITSGGGKAPFGASGANIYLDGTVRIDAGGQTLATLAANAAEMAITYIGEFASAPSTAGRKKNNVYRNTSNGNTYILNADGGAWQLYLEKGAAGSAGSRGSITLYQNGVAYSDAAATSLVLSVTGTAPAIGDTVSFTTGSGASASTTTRYWTGSSWALPGVVINGNLLVGGVISSTAMNSSQYVRAYGLFGSGSAGAAIMGENSTHSGYAIIGNNTSASGTGAIAGATVGSGVGINGSSTGGIGVRAQGGTSGVDAEGSATGVRAVATGVGGVGLYADGGVGGPAIHCDGSFRFGTVTINGPPGAATQYLDGAGNWKRPNLSDILPNMGDAPGFQFSTDGGSTWTAILLRRV